MDLKNEIQLFLSRGNLKPYQLAELAGVPRSSVYRLLCNTKSKRNGVMVQTADKLRKAMKQNSFEQSGASAPKQSGGV